MTSLKRQLTPLCVIFHECSGTRSVSECGMAANCLGFFFFLFPLLFHFNFFFFFFFLLSMQLHFIAGHSLGSLTCTQMSLHVIAHGGCANSERKSAPKVDFGREENPLPQRRFEPAWQLQSTKSSHSELKTRLRTFLFRQFFVFVFFIFSFLFFHFFLIFFFIHIMGRPCPRAQISCI